MSHVPVDPTKPKDALLIPRPRPGTVTLAGTLMLAGAALGLLNAVLVIAATGGSTSEFRARAGMTAATAEQIDEIATGLATWSTTAGMTGLVLSVVLAVLAIQVLHGSHSARLAAVAFLAASILFGLGWSSFTVRGGSSLHPDGMDEQTGRGVAEALGLSTSGLPTYVGGGLTCLQILGYATVLGLLLWPASHPYFRRSRPALLGRRSRSALLGRRSRTAAVSRMSLLSRGSRAPQGGPQNRAGSFSGQSPAGGLDQDPDGAYRPGDDIRHILAELAASPGRFGKGLRDGSRAVTERTSGESWRRRIARYGRARWATWTSRRDRAEFDEQSPVSWLDGADPQPRDPAAVFEEAVLEGHSGRFWRRSPATWFGAWNRAAWFGRRGWTTAEGRRIAVGSVRVLTGAFFLGVRRTLMFARPRRWLMSRRERRWTNVVGRPASGGQATPVDDDVTDGALYSTEEAARPNQ